MPPSCLPFSTGDKAIPPDAPNPSSILRSPSDANGCNTIRQHAECDVLIHPLDLRFALPDTTA